jgi:tetratricopeptide (TPR) repeat protein
MNPSVVLLFFILLIVSRGIVVFVHELGHALPALAFTKNKVSIYIGSYGDPEKSIHFKIRNLEVWLKYTLFSWRNGLCITNFENKSIDKQIFYVLMGPVLPFLLAIAYFYIAFSNDFGDFYLLFALSFLIVSVFDLFHNLIPDKTPIKLYDGTITYNDGYNALKLFNYKKLPKQYHEAVDYFEKKEYQKSIQLFDSLLALKLKDETIYRFNFNANIEIKNFEKASQLFNKLEKEFQLSSNDYAAGGLVLSKLNQHEQSLFLYDKSLQLNAKNSYSLNNKGYTLNLLERYTEAITYFDKAIEVDEQFAYAFNNRGLAKIKIGKITEGLNDFSKSNELDENNSYYFRNLGIYHFDQGEIDQARALFLKAKSLDEETHGIDELILSTEKN